MLIQTTLIYAGLLGLLLVVLSFNVMANWVRVTGKGLATDREMRRAERILSSFVEYVPMALLLLALIELHGAPPFVIHMLGGALVLARLLHAYGSNAIKGSGFLRFLGAQLTFLVLAVASLACIYYFFFARGV
ncbi:MAG TPA: MAPEG family protein [Alphaproteobacteria bacterium]|nr:MAPEG family protein [Alphaproteobacteria bacterium]